MIALSRIHIESPLSAEELRARIERSMGHTLGLSEPMWAVDNTPFIGEMNGLRFHAQRRSRSRYLSVDGALDESAIHATIGMPGWRMVVAIASIIAFPIAIYLWVTIAIDWIMIENKLRQLAGSQ
jgi:hypothetical protein